MATNRILVVAKRARLANKAGGLRAFFPKPTLLTLLKVQSEVVQPISSWAAFENENATFICPHRT